MILLIMVFSFFLEATFSIYIPLFTHWSSLLFTLVSLLFCSQYFSNMKHYYGFCFGIGILYDIVFTNTLFFHGFLFVLMGYLYQKIIHLLSYTWYNFLCIILFLIFVYRIMSYFILTLVGYTIWSLDQLLRVLMASFVCNAFYGLFLYGMDAIMKNRNHRYKRKF